MINAKNVLKKICFALFLLFVAGLAIGHYSGFWPRLRIFWHLDSQIPAVQAAMKEYLQNKYDENFEVERPEILYDRYGCRLTTKASPADNPDLKFDIRTDHYRFRDPFQPQNLLKKFHESFPGARWGFRWRDYKRRLGVLFPRTVSKREKELRQKHQNVIQEALPISEEIKVYVKSIEDSEKSIKTLDLFRIIEKHGSEKPIPSVYYETIIYTNHKIDKHAEAERFYEIFNEHFLKCKTNQFVIAILYYSQNDRKEVERKLRERETMSLWKPDEWRKSFPPDQANEIASVSFRYSHFREALDADHKKGELQNAFIISSYDCQGGPISKEKIIKSFLY